ncbi:MAG TPA: LacI family transcriptional regulator [Actinobacteria bacterium]|nr:LacI family transcriptional regulator [Actinomycetota bacterium]
MIANIKDVANRAGVSATTVSAYLNKSVPVNKTTAKRIKEAIEELGYRPNLIARSLRQKKTNTIGLIVCNILSNFYSVIAKSVEDSARKYGFKTILCNGDDNPEKELEYIKVLESSRVEGIILAPTGKNGGYIKEIIESGMKIVLIDRLVDGVNCNEVRVDNENGSYKAVKHLIEQGYKRIGIISGSMDITTGKERLDGYLKALREANLSENDDFIKIGDFKKESGVNLAKELLEGKNIPDAIFSTNLDITKGVLTVIRQMGLKVPEDIGLVGFDDSDLTQLFNPPITVISQPVYEIGSTAMEIMINEIKSDKNVEKAPIKKFLKTKLVKRASTRKIN